MRHQIDHAVAVAGLARPRGAIDRLLAGERRAIANERRVRLLVVLETKTQSRREEAVPEVGTDASEQHRIALLETLRLPGTGLLDRNFVPMLPGQSIEPPHQPAVAHVRESPTLALVDGRNRQGDSVDGLLS